MGGQRDQKQYATPPASGKEQRRLVCITLFFPGKIYYGSSSAYRAVIFGSCRCAVSSSSNHGQKVVQHGIHMVWNGGDLEAPAHHCRGRSRPPSTSARSAGGPQYSRSGSGAPASAGGRLLDPCEMVKELRGGAGANLQECGSPRIWVQGRASDVHGLLHRSFPTSSGCTLKEVRTPSSITPHARK